ELKVRARQTTGKAAVGDKGDALPPREVLQRRRDLGRLLHAGPGWPRTDQDDDVAFAHGPTRRSLHRLNRVALVGKHARGPAMTIEAIGIDNRRIDGGCLHDRALWRDVS